MEERERERERDVASWGQVNHERRLSLGPWKTQGQCPVVPTVKIRHWGPQAAGELYPNLFLSDVSISRTNQAEKPGPEGGSETGFIKSTPASSTIELAAECLGEGGGVFAVTFRSNRTFAGGWVVVETCWVQVRRRSLLRISTFFLAFSKFWVITSSWISSHPLFSMK